MYITTPSQVCWRDNHSHLHRSPSIYPIEIIRYPLDIVTEWTHHNQDSTTQSDAITLLDIPFIPSHHVYSSLTFLKTGTLRNTMPHLVSLHPHLISSHFISFCFIRYSILFTDNLAAMPLYLCCYKRIAFINLHIFFHPLLQSAIHYVT